MVFELPVLVEPGVQGTYFLGQQILGLMELPEVFFLSLVNDGENKGSELVDSADLGELGTRVTLAMYSWESSASGGPGDSAALPSRWEGSEHCFWP